MNVYMDQTQTQSAGVVINQQLLEACIEALSLFDNYPETWEAIGTYQVLTQAVEKAIKS